MNMSNPASPIPISELGQSNQPGQSNIDVHPQLDKRQREQIVATLRQFAVLHAALFGSFARGDTHADSDVDILIEPPPGMTLLDLARLENSLTDALARSVQLVTFEDLHPAMRERVRREQQELL